jgi:hypothetical protein
MKQQVVKPDLFMNADASAAMPKTVEAIKIAPKQADPVIIKEGGGESEAMKGKEASDGAEGVEHEAEKHDGAAGRGP